MGRMLVVEVETVLEVRTELGRVLLGEEAERERVGRDSTVLACRRMGRADELVAENWAKRGSS
jgi:hypothetical protein